MIEIASGPFRLTVDPATGGSVASLDWHGHPLLRRQQGTGVLNSASFPMVPFHNRLRHSRFGWQGEIVALHPNHPDNPAEPAMHGLGWRLPWRVATQAADGVELALEVAGSRAAGEWPWSFRAEQGFHLDGDGVLFTLAISNRADVPMPAGLGFHPFFPCDATTRLIAHHRGEWQVDAACLPISLDRRDTAIDWWAGQPVGSRAVDTVYTERVGDMAIHWPARGIGVAILSSQDLPFTTVYAPPAPAFVCVEPVSHSTDAFNRPEPDNGMRVLAPGERWQVIMRLQPFTMP